MHFIKKHIEWVVLGTGLLLLGLMNPENAGTSLCVLNWIGIPFCPGDGLGHSISYTFHGDVSAALEAHIAGPAAIVILSGRIIHIWKNLYSEHKNLKKSI